MSSELNSSSRSTSQEPDASLGSCSNTLITVSGRGWVLGGQDPTLPLPLHSPPSGIRPHIWKQLPRGGPFSGPSSQTCFTPVLGPNLQVAFSKGPCEHDCKALGSRTTPSGASEQGPHPSGVLFSILRGRACLRAEGLSCGMCGQRAKRPALGPATSLSGLTLLHLRNEDGDTHQHSRLSWR